MKIIEHYNSHSTLLSTWLVSIGLVFPALLAQILLPGTQPQEVDFNKFFFSKVFIAQFLHLNWQHFLVNIAGLGIITWGLARDLPPKQWAWICSLSLLATPLWLTWIEPLQWYMGLSGALHAQFTCLVTIAVFQLGKPRGAYWPTYALVAGLTIKLVFEAIAPEARFDDLINAPIALEAHRGSAALGLLLGLASTYWKRMRTKRAPNRDKSLSEKTNHSNV